MLDNLTRFFTKFWYHILGLTTFVRTRWRRWACRRLTSYTTNYYVGTKCLGREVPFGDQVRCSSALKGTFPQIPPKSSDVTQNITTVSIKLILSFLFRHVTVDIRPRLIDLIRRQWWIWRSHSESFRFPFIFAKFELFPSNFVTRCLLVIDSQLKSTYRK